ncbi:MAG: Organic solvent tolerance protein OstA-like protein [Akkermansiaceae bacterium]|nr:Organic solvent tolerance protein OstA-like protein [Akkermansiaceae bacterium]
MAPIVPIEPVPVPKGLDVFPQGNADIPAQPKSIHMDADPGVPVRMDGATQDIFVDGPLKAVTDNGVTIVGQRGHSEGATQKIYLDGKVHVNTHTGIEIFADHAVADPDSTTLTLTGNTSIYRGNLLQRGGTAVYNWETQKLDASDMRAGMDPIILEAGKFTMEDRDGKQVYVGHNAGVTTHDVEDPGFWLRATETTVYPDKVNFRNLKLYAGDTPIFWLPYLSQPLDGDLGYHFVPGARSNWGAYLLNTYGILLGEGQNGQDPWLLSKWHFDLRSRRGVGTGVDLSDTRQKDNPNLTGLSLYYSNDLDPSLSRSGVTRGFVNEDRYRVALQERVDFKWETNADWRLDTNLNILSDQYYLEDFQPEAFRSDPAPDNTIGLFRRDDASLFSVYTRLRPNDFYRSDTRAPEIDFDMARRPIFGTSILHEGTTSLAFVSEGIGSSSLPDVRALLSLPAGDPRVPYLLNQLPTYERQLLQTIRSLPQGSPALPALTSQLFSPSYTRFNTYQELSRPFKIGGWLNITPEIGAGYTRYSDVSGPTDSVDSFAFHAGAEASVKFAKDYGDVENRTIGLDGLMHVFQPYARYSYVSTDDLDPTFPSIDRETFTTRPQTLSVPRYTATDSLRDWNIVRIGARNRILTQRDGQTFEWLSMDTYIDGFITDPDYNRKFSNLYNDVRWNPLPWFGLNLETQFPVIDQGDGFSEVAARARFMPSENVEFSIGDRLLDNHPVLQDSHRIDLRTYLRLTEHWGLGLFQLWELDDGTLEIQQYTIHHDFNHWVASLGFTKQDNRVQSEYGVVLSFTLKDFPSASLPLKLDAGGGTDP